MTIFLAQVWGLYLLVVGVGILLNPKGYQKASEEIIKSPALMLITGALALMLGIVLVSVHTYLVLGWPAIVTFLGWLTLYKGVMRVVFPDTSVKILKKMITIKALRISAIVSIVIGGLLTYIAFYWAWSH